MVDTGLAEQVIPEIPAWKLTIDEHHQHKGRSSALPHRAAAGDRPEESDPGPVLRWAALLHDIGKPATRRHEGGGVRLPITTRWWAPRWCKRMRALKYPKATVEDVATLVFLHLRFHGYGDGAWTDSAVRRYVTDAGDLLDRLNK